MGKNGKLETNVERMARGVAPIGHDGKSVELHHLNQSRAGPVIEIKKGEHTKYGQAIHVNKGTGVDPKNYPSWRRDVNADAAFEAWKAKYWTARVKDFPRNDG